MISEETYVRVVSQNASKIMIYDMVRDKDDLKRALKYHNSTIRNMGKRLRDKKHPLDSSLVSAYVLNYELSRLFAKLIRSKINKDDKYLQGNLQEDAEKLWTKYEKGELVWKNDN